MWHVEKGRHAIELEQDGSIMSQLEGRDWFRRRGRAELTRL